MGQGRSVGAERGITRSGAYSAAGKTGRRRVRRSGAVRAEERRQLLELHAVLLRSTESQCRELGICEREMFRDSGSEIRRWQIVQTAANRRATG